MLDIDSIEQIDNLKASIKETLNLSIVCEDSLMHRNRTGFDNPHVISLVQLIIERLKLVDENFEYLVRRFK